LPVGCMPLRTRSRLAGAAVSVVWLTGLRF
jgi:hypothetical protein